MTESKGKNKDLYWRCPECGELNPVGLKLCKTETCLYNRDQDFLNTDLLEWRERSGSDSPDAID